MPKYSAIVFLILLIIMSDTVISLLSARIMKNLRNKNVNSTSIYMFNAWYVLLASIFLKNSFMFIANVFPRNIDASVGWIVSFWIGKAIESIGIWYFYLKLTGRR